MKHHIHMPYLRMYYLYQMDGEGINCVFPISIQPIQLPRQPPELLYEIGLILYGYLWTVNMHCANGSDKRIAYRQRCNWADSYTPQVSPLTYRCAELVLICRDKSWGNILFMESKLCEHIPALANSFNFQDCMFPLRGNSGHQKELTFFLGL